MAKASAPLRRMRKTGFAKGEYYPKVDLSALDGRLPSSWSPSSVVTPAEPAADEESVVAAEPAREEEQAMPPPVVYLEPPAAPAPAVAAPRADEDVLTLPASLDLPSARPLAAALLARRGKPIVIDASAVGQVGAQCVQVLLSAKRTWQADGVSLSIVNCAPRMIEDLRLIGIDRTLMIGELSQ